MGPPFTYHICVFLSGHSVNQDAFYAVGVQISHCVSQYIAFQICQALVMQFPNTTKGMNGPSMTHSWAYVESSQDDAAALSSTVCLVSAFIELVTPLPVTFMWSYIPVNGIGLSGFKICFQAIGLQCTCTCTGVVCIHMACVFWLAVQESCCLSVNLVPFSSTPPPGCPQLVPCFLLDSCSVAMNT